MTPLERIAPYRKAAAAIVLPALFTAWAALADDVVTAQEWLLVAASALGTGGAVYRAPNDPMPAASPPPAPDAT